VRPDNIKDPTDELCNMAEAVFFASMVLVNLDDPFDPDAKTNGSYLPIYRGYSVHPKFLGFEEI
jgi:hypothetical protein